MSDRAPAVTGAQESWRSNSALAPPAEGVGPSGRTSDLMTSSVQSAQFDVNGELTPDRLPSNRPPRTRKHHREYENPEYAAMLRRTIRAYGHRVAEGEVEGLPDLLNLQNEVEEAAAAAVSGLRKFGYSWEEIARRVGITRQAAQQRWGHVGANALHSGSEAKR
jgi:hypothetical protein